MKLIIDDFDDMLGRQLSIGDFVVIAHPNKLSPLSVCKISKFTPKMMVVIPMHGKQTPKHVYANQTVKIPAEDVTFYLLKQQKA